MQGYRAPGWLPGGNLQTLWPALASRRTLGPAPRWRRERWDTPDGDFIDVDFAGAALPEPPTPGAIPPATSRSPGDGRPPALLVLFHGLEGSSASHYAQAFADAAGRAGWACAVPHFRGCSGELNRAPRAYHSGDHEEIGWILQRLRLRAGGPVRAAGVSLGGNALLRWAAEAGDTAAGIVESVAAVSAPVDLAASGDAIGRGFNRLVYTRLFLRTMKPKALAKWDQHPGLFDRDRLLAAHSLEAFDDVFTAPLHGFRGTRDYWAKASAKPHLPRVRVPALLLNALNDPFVPAHSLPQPGSTGGWVTAWQPAHGGHVGFPAGAPPGHVTEMPARVLDWMRSAEHPDRHGPLAPAAPASHRR